MTNREIRSEVIELVNSGLKVSQIVAYFAEYVPAADLKRVRKEAKDIMKESGI